jgi:hypothetical protein
LDEKRLRWLDYEFINRIIVWENLSKFVVFILPFLDSTGITKLLKKVFLFTTLLGPLSMDLKSDDDKAKLACASCAAYPPSLPQILEYFLW